MPTPRLEANPSVRRPAISIPAVIDLEGGGDFDMNHHWRRADTGYTSLRDILTSSSSTAGGHLSPSASAAPGAGEIRIRNRLVKQAAYAYAYLHPTPSSVESSSPRGPIRRLLAVLSCGLAGSCFDFVGRFFQSIRR